MAGSKVELMPGETMVLSANPHWFYFWKHVAAASVVIVVAVLAWIFDMAWLSTLLWWVAGVGLALLLVALAAVLVQWRSTHFAVTDRRVAYTTGVFRRRGVSIPLNRINNVNFEQSLLARVLDNGVVTIESAGDTGDSVFENIPHPSRVRTTIFAQMEADEQSDSHRDAEAIADALHGHRGSSQAESTAAARLSELADLRQQGLISEQEYDAKRRDVLDGL
ncbi:MAG TPA: PH domain-containing protein [Ornithinimicrobium sp.]|uniref:PH domain-containing protein n=1 Tax=Ornithinimicrobium sp. TaxID=1977084 RepID=UPI002B462E9A|nr:PH domain-containing protein [Ornithinimicrobium sp.]HKJ12871.1 PH domain-containing protein [Ornithinimicrobium sp.]